MSVYEKEGRVFTRRGGEGRACAYLVGEGGGKMSIYEREYL